jgi:hypothetical protein
MTPFLLSFLLLFTIVVAFVLGISLGYWAVCGILYLFSPGRTQGKLSRNQALAQSPGGD